tara:strand:- start:53 stop:448 length:396 start_codon:yes stop_codon:yes gene_type:complete
MSTLKVDQIQNTSDAHSSTPQQIAQGRAKAWVEFEGIGSHSILGSYNVSSVSNPSNGNYTVNFSTSFANTNYAALATSGADLDTYDDGLDGADNVAIVCNKAVGNVKVACADTDNGDADDNHRVSVVIFAS